MEYPTLLPTPSNFRSSELLAAAEQAVRDYCGWHICPAVTETMVLDGSGTGSLFLPSNHVTGVISLTNGGQAIDHETLEWSELGFARLPAGQLWTDSLRGVRITLTHGYESVPIVVEMIREMAARAEASPGGLVEARAGDISEKRSMTAPGVAGGIVLMAHEREQLNPYRIRGS